ncbi:hypothetical protein C8Q74DRAFT_981085 [Fomes fomentarius]|nr:hypothetical protein C8Q74DRAFT_981085 [Fomes fomentarius]
MRIATTRSSPSGYGIIAPRRHVNNPSRFNLFISVSIPALALSLFTRSTHARSLPRADQLTFATTDGLPLQCASYQFSWTGGTPPYSVSVTSDPSLDASIDFATSGQDAALVPPFPAGFDLLLSLTDSTGLTLTRTDPIQPSSDSSCLPDGLTIKNSSSPASVQSPIATTTDTPPPTESTPVSTIPHRAPQPGPSEFRPTSNNTSTTSTSDPSPLFSSASLPVTTSFPVSSGSSTEAMPTISPSASAISASQQGSPLLPPDGIAGVIIGGAVTLLVAGVALCFAVRLRRRQHASSRAEDDVYHKSSDASNIDTHSDYAYPELEPKLEPKPDWESQAQTAPSMVESAPSVYSLSITSTSRDSFYVRSAGLFGRRSYMSTASQLPSAVMQPDFRSGHWPPIPDATSAVLALQGAASGESRDGRMRTVSTASPHHVYFAHIEGIPISHS